MFNFLKKNAIFSAVLSIGSLLVPVFFAYAETLTVTPEIVVPSAPIVATERNIPTRSEPPSGDVVVRPPDAGLTTATRSVQNVSLPIPHPSETFRKAITDFLGIFTDGFAVVGNDVGTGMYASAVNYSNAFSGAKNFVSRRTGVAPSSETFGNVSNTVTSFFSTGATVIGNSFETAFANTKNSYAGAFASVAGNVSRGLTHLGNLPNINQIEIIGAQNISSIFTDGFGVVGNNIKTGMKGSIAIYKNFFVTTGGGIKDTKNILVDGSRVIGGYVVVGVTKNIENIVAVRNLPTQSGGTSGGSASLTSSSPDVVSDRVRNISSVVGRGFATSSETFGNVSNTVTSFFSTGATVIGNSFETAFANTKNSYAGAFASVAGNVSRGLTHLGNLPNINQIEIIGAQNLLTIFTDGFGVVGGDVKTGVLSSAAVYKNAYRETADTLAQIGNALGEKTSNFATATLATRSSWDSFWCWAKGLFGFDCPALNSNIAKIPIDDKNVPNGVVRPSPAVVAVVPFPPSPPPDVVSDRVRNISPVAVAPAKQVLSFTSIVASLKNIFAPISLTDILGARITALEKKSSTGGASSSEILALQNQINTINASRYFSPSYSYTPTAMIGGNGQAVVFNASGPNGVFENGITAQTGTFTSGVTAGSFSTAGTLSVTGATTLSGAFNGGNTLYIDAVNGRVGIGTSTPTDTLSVNGPLYFAPITPSATVGRLYNNGGDLYWAGNLIGGATTDNWATDGTNAWRTTGNVGIGTTTPGQKLSVAGDILGNNFIASYFTATTSTATSTFAGNFAVDGTTRLATSLTGVLKSVGGYVTASLTNLTSDVTGILGLSNGGTGTSTAPTYGKVLIGNSGGTYDLNATSTLGLMNSLGAEYSTTQIGSAQTLATSTADTNLGLTIVSNGNTHTFTPYWIGTLANNRLTNSTISGIALGGTLGALTATDSTLTFSGNYDGSTARTVGLNLGNANTWTALQQFNANASTTQLSVSNTAYFAGSGIWNSLGNVGIGTTSPYAKLSVVGEAVADYFTATSITGTSTFAGNINVDSGALTYTQSSGIVDIANLSLGAQSFESDAGILSWMDMPVTSASPLGTVNSYSAQMDSNPLLTMYSESLGNGNTWKNAVGIGTTTPIATLSIQSATSTTGTTSIFDVAGLTGESFMRMIANGNLGLGTTSPTRRFSISNTASVPQMSIAYDNTNYAELTVSATGDLTLSSSGKDILTYDDNFWICSGGACQTTTNLLAGVTGNLVVENDVEIGGNYTQTCPTGYIWAPGSAKYGTMPGFCVMKYEAKGSAGAVVSTPTGSPYVSLDQPTARTQCEAIGAGYHLISEPEWMTIAENIATTPINDLESTAGLQLATGHSANTPASALATTAGADPVITSCNKRLPLSDASNAYSSTCQLRGDGAYGADDNDKGYYGTGQAYSSTYTAVADNDAQLRTAVLSNGQVIWDIPGNVSEWTDAYVQGLPEKPQPTADAWIEYTAVTDFSTLNYARPKNPAWTSANGIGQYYAGAPAGLRGFQRVGSWEPGAGSGAFTLDLSSAPSNVYTSVGFRCAR